VQRYVTWLFRVAPEHVHKAHFTSLCNLTLQRDLLAKHIPPPRYAAGVDVGEPRWVRMGFPQKRSEQFPSLCACHGTFKYNGYFCPQCKSKFCELPTDCRVCGITLVSSPHLARSYHHLFP
jgi:transcription initiation factor TFIIH subunit 2